MKAKRIARKTPRSKAIAAILKMWTQMWRRNSRNAVWTVNSNLEKDLIPLTEDAPSLAQILRYTLPRRHSK
jgi:hypothetical protein